MACVLFWCLLPLTADSACGFGRRGGCWPGAAHLTQARDRLGGRDDRQTGGLFVKRPIRGLQIAVLILEDLLHFLKGHRGLLHGSRLVLSPIRLRRSEGCGKSRKAAGGKNVERPRKPFSSRQAGECNGVKCALRRIVG